MQRCLLQLPEIRDDKEKRVLQFLTSEVFTCSKTLVADIVGQIILAAKLENSYTALKMIMNMMLKFIVPAKTIFCMAPLKPGDIYLLNFEQFVVKLFNYPQTGTSLVANIKYIVKRIPVCQGGTVHSQ